MVKKLCISIIICFFCSLFAGCYDKYEVDDLAYVIAIGIDKGTTNILRLTLQLAKPTAIGGGGGGGGGGGVSEGGKEAMTFLTVETPSIVSGLNMANNVIGKKISLSHAKTLVFSKELARDGIGSYINSLPRNREIRPNIMVVVSRNSAEDYIKAIEPTLVINPAKFYELSYDAFKFTGFTARTDFHRFYSQAKSTCQSPVAVLAGVSRFESSKEFDLKGSTFADKGRPYPLEGDFKAGEMPKTGDVKAEVMGLAVFDGSKMIGELDGEETLYHLMLDGEYNHSFITIPDPLKKEDMVILDVKQSRYPVKRVDISGGKPKIYAKIMLEADIQAIESGIEYERPENIRILEKSYEDFIREGISRYLKRTTGEFKADINGFGKIAKIKFLTWDEWEKFNWLNKYKDSTFDVDVDLKIRRTGLMIKTVPIKSSEGKSMSE